MARLVWESRVVSRQQYTVYANSLSTIAKMTNSAVQKLTREMLSTNVREVPFFIESRTNSHSYMLGISGPITVLVS